ncbi:putative lipid II flippase FtsW [Vibrio barjaei]|uniref:putative lipid II flippase FtsW n=1 Tax=Vibrio barjaei TaxID=1676683 RepID=UPI002284C159|nr:putative lipid II flippase FtsW [Vibrio barjaei]MCY9873839.1 putative lipid II flippase FtsW [Vibrio barjaei]
MFSIIKTDPSAPYDRSLVFLSLSLFLIGLITVASSSFPHGLSYTYKHATFIGISIIVLLATCNISNRTLINKSPQLLMLALLFLVIVISPLGKTVNGAQRWIPLGLFNFQPAELTKLAFFIFLSSYLDRKNHQVKSSMFGAYAKPAMAFGLFAALLLQQPDFGTVVVIAVVSLSMVFIAGARIRDTLTIAVCGLCGIFALILSAPYRMKRVISFLDPWQDPFGSGYQLTQSLMAFGRGGWTGQGLGNSVLKLNYLPEAHTDFIFAILSEELGFLGVIIVLALLLLLALKALHIGTTALELGRGNVGFLACGFCVWFSFQTFVNIGAASGMLPTKGLTLPLVSYGGSSLIIMSITIGILLRIDYENRNYK